MLQKKKQETVEKRQKVVSMTNSTKNENKEDITQNACRLVRLIITILYTL